MTDHGWTIGRLAAELDVSTSTVERWRAGESRIPRSVEIALEALEQRQP